MYGPRASNNNGLYRIVESAIKTGKVQYKGSSESMREYIHVEDAARASIAILDQSFQNESIVLTGPELMRVSDLLKMIAEILNIDQDSIEFIDGHPTGHYVRTPYTYHPKLRRKYVNPVHVDLGQGLVQVIHELQGL